jgi:hypothetical protein
MLISQFFGTEVRVTVDTKVLNTGIFVFPKITTNYVKKQIAPVNFPQWILKNKTKVITTAKIYPVKVVDVVVKTANDQYPIKELKEYYRFPKKSLATVITQNNMRTTGVFVPSVTTVLTKYPLGSFTTVSNTQVPVTYYNATGTFWSTS